MIKAVRNFKINNTSYIRKFFSPKIKEKSITTAVKTSMPVVSVPIIAYLKPTKIRTNIRETNKNIEQANHNRPDDITWNEKQSRRLLKENGITRKAEQDRLIREDGKLTDEGNRRVSFKGHEELTTDGAIGTNGYTNIDPELTSIDAELAGLDSEHAHLVYESALAQDTIDSGLVEEMGLDKWFAKAA